MTGQSFRVVEIPRFCPCLVRACSASGSLVYTKRCLAATHPDISGPVCDQLHAHLNAHNAFSLPDPSQALNPALRSACYFWPRHPRADDKPEKEAPDDPGFFSAVASYFPALPSWQRVKESVTSLPEDLRRRFTAASDVPVYASFSNWQAGLENLASSLKPSAVSELSSRLYGAIGSRLSTAKQFLLEEETTVLIDEIPETPRRRGTYLGNRAAASWQWLRHSASKLAESEKLSAAANWAIAPVRQLGAAFTAAAEYTGLDGALDQAARLGESAARSTVNAASEAARKTAAAARSTLENTKVWVAQRSIDLANSLDPNGRAAELWREAKTSAANFTEAWRPWKPCHCEPVVIVKIVHVYHCRLTTWHFLSSCPSVRPSSPLLYVRFLALLRQQIKRDAALEQQHKARNDQSGNEAGYQAKLRPGRQLQAASYSTDPLSEYMELPPEPAPLRPVETPRIPLHTEATNKTDFRPAVESPETAPSSGTADRPTANSTSKNSSGPGPRKRATRPEEPLPDWINEAQKIAFKVWQDAEARARWWSGEFVELTLWEQIVHLFNLYCYYAILWSGLCIYLWFLSTYDCSSVLPEVLQTYAIFAFLFMLFDHTLKFVSILAILFVFAVLKGNLSGREMPRGGAGNQPAVESDGSVTLNHTDFNGWFRYNVPGDGFCGIYAMLGLHREMRYLENQAYLAANGQADHLRETLVRPMLQDFLLFFATFPMNDKGLDFSQPLDHIPIGMSDGGIKITKDMTADIRAVWEWLSPRKGPTPGDLGGDFLYAFAQIFGLCGGLFQPLLPSMVPKNGRDSKDCPDFMILNENNHFTVLSKNKLNLRGSRSRYLDAAVLHSPKLAGKHYITNDLANGLAAGLAGPLAFVERTAGQPGSKSAAHKAPPAAAVDAAKTEAVLNALSIAPKKATPPAEAPPKKCTNPFGDPITYDYVPDDEPTRFLGESKLPVRIPSRNLPDAGAAGTEPMAEVGVNLAPVKKPVENYTLTTNCVDPYYCSGWIDPVNKIRPLFSRKKLWAVAEVERARYAAGKLAEAAPALQADGDPTASGHPRKEKRKTTGLDQNGKAMYECRYRSSGIHFDSFIGSQPIIHKPCEGYSHPMLRAVSNWALLRAYERAHRLGCRVVDVACKYHHVLSWLAGSPVRALLSRPEIGAFDAAYNRRYCDRTGTATVEIDRSDRFRLGVNSPPPLAEDDYLVLHDVAYYPDVLEGLRATKGPLSGCINMIIYPQKPGEYTYFDKEGNYSVTQDGHIEARPAGNPEYYRHPLPTFLPGQSYALRRGPGDGYIVMNPSRTTQIGPECHFVEYDIFDSMDNFGNEPPQEWAIDPAAPPLSYELNFLDPVYRKAVRTLVEGNAKYRTIVAHVEERNITYTPDRALYDLLCPHVRAKQFVDKPDVGSSVYLTSVKFPGKYSHADILMTTLCVVKDGLSSDVSAHRFLNHPKNQPENDLHFAASIFRRLFFGSLLALFWATCSLRIWLANNRISYGPWPGTGAFAEVIFWLAVAFWLGTGFVAQVLLEYVLLDHAVAHQDYGSKWYGPLSLYSARAWRLMRGGRTAEYQVHPDQEIKARHYDPFLSKRVYLPLGNVYVTVLRKTRALLCTCKNTYAAVFHFARKALHFGSCRLNVDASIFTRQFNATLFPNDDARAAFEEFVNVDFAEFEKALPLLIDAAKLDFSLERFLADSAPAKRKMYAQAFEDYRLGRWRPKVKFFSKTNEIHYDDSARPRNIACFDPVFTAFAAYCARLMIKIMKQWKPGFTSGLNLEQLGDHIAKARYFTDMNGPNWYMADGSSFDAHQHRCYISHIDHRYGPLMFKALAPWLDLPSALFESFSDYMFSPDYDAVSTKKDKLVVHGTVLSGHPTLTTLFNTLRSILYQEYALACQNNHGIVFAAGDDVLVATTKPVDYKAYSKILPPFAAGFVGLGICMKDFKAGYLHELDFLSKNFIALGTRVECYRLASKVAVSGAATEAIPKIGWAQYCAMQALQLADLPRRLQAAWRRFVKRGATVLKPKLLEAMQFDWSYKAYLGVTEKVLDDLFYWLHPPLQALFRGGRTADERPQKYCTRKRMNNPQAKMKNNKPRRPVAYRKQRKAAAARAPPAQARTALNPARPRTNRRRRISTTSFASVTRGFAAGIAHPERRIATRWPQPIPTPTFASKWSGSQTVSANASGAFCIYLDTSVHHEFGIKHAATGVSSVTASSAWTFTAAATYPLSANFTRWRLVSASLSVIDTGPSQTRSGVFFAASVPMTTLVNSAYTFDTLRDSEGSVVVNTERGARAVCLPVEPDAANFSTNSFSWNVPIIALTGGLANGTYTLDYHVNFEAIPKGDKSDLLATENGPFGDPQAAVRAVGQSRLSGLAAGAVAGSVAVGLPGSMIFASNAPRPRNGPRYPQQVTDSRYHAYFGAAPLGN